MIIKHKEFREVTEGHDIALIKLKESVDLNTYTPVCLPSEGDSFTGENGWVYGQLRAERIDLNNVLNNGAMLAGWGTTLEGGSQSNKLLELEIPIVSDSVCRKAFTDKYGNNSPGVSLRRGISMAS